MSEQDRKEDVKQVLSEMSDGALAVAIGRFQQDALAEAYRRHAGAVFGLARVFSPTTLEQRKLCKRYLCACGMSLTALIPNVELCAASCLRMPMVEPLI